MKALMPVKTATIRLLCICLALAPLKVAAYRPFESTDADVVDQGETEIELGYLNWEQLPGDDLYLTPQIVYNYGISNTLELVAEFEVEHPADGKSELVDPAIFLKGMWREGVMQDKTGFSLAWEAGLLLPSSIEGEDRTGFEAIGILSGQISSVTYHINFGGGLDRVDHTSFGLWGVIGELPLQDNLKLVGEINGESLRGERAETSALLGVVWEPSSSSGLSLDAAVRRGLSSNTPDWAATIGVTFSF